MGINQLLNVKITNPKSSYCGKKLGEIFTYVSVADLAGRWIAIDASNVIYRAFLGMGKTTLTDARGNPTQHISVIMSWIIRFAKANVMWVFDSPEVTPLKHAERAKRRSRKSADDFSMTTDIVEQVQTLLRLAGVAYVTAPPKVEAEQYAAYLCRPRDDRILFDYVLSADTDVLVCGAPMLMPNTDAKKAKFPYKLYRPSELCSHLDITLDQFMHMAIALGTDFNDKIAGVGPATVVNKIRNNDLRGVLAYTEVIKYFTADFTGMSAPLTDSEPDYNKLEVFLADLNFSRGLVDKLKVARNSA